MELTEELIRNIVTMIDKRNELRNIVDVMRIAKERYTDTAKSAAVVVCGQTMVYHFEALLRQVEDEMKANGLTLE
jgi:hypothetical protein